MTDSTQDVLHADSPSQIKQAVWCGAVCALAAVITSLNLYPPVNVQYKVSTRVVVSQTRLNQLKLVLERDRKIIASGRLRYVQLCSLKLLDEVKNDGLLLIELDSLWTGRASHSHIETWLATISKTEPRGLVDSSEARDERFSRWQAELAKNYLKHHQYISSVNQASEKLEPTSTRFTSTPSTESGVPIKFANLSSNSIQGLQSSTVPGQLDVGALDREDPLLVERRLAENVKLAEANVKKTEELFNQALEKHAGAIELVGSPRIRSKTNSIPTWMSASVLILAFATGAIASQLQYRAQSGGAYDPKFVSDQLAVDGLPVLASIKIAPLGHEASGPTTPRGVLNIVKNVTGQHLVGVGEGLLLIWCCVIACRILFDPLWRSVAIESPLAAFGRLVSGMP